MNIFITGATGFVGTHLCRKLMEQGHQVFGLVRNENKLHSSGLKILPIKGSLSFNQQNDWLDQLPETLDCVVHVAGIVHSFKENEFININALATDQLVIDLKNKYQHLKMVFISSLAAAGPGEKSETDPLTPVSQYGISKKIAEEKLPNDWDVTIIRPPMVIGPGDPAILDIYKMVKSRMVLTAGSKARFNRYSFVCVHDLVDGIIKSLNKTNESRREEYFISHGDTVTFEDIISEISSCMKIKPTYLSLPKSILKFTAKTLSKLPLDFRLTPDKVNELLEPSWVCSNKKSLNELEMTYQWDLKKTIELTYQDYKQRQWI